MRIYSHLIVGIFLVLVTVNLFGSCPGSYQSCPCTPRASCSLDAELSCVCCCYNRDDKIAHSFMYTRPLNQHMSTVQALWHNIVYEKQPEMKSGLQIIGAYQQSMPRDADKRYFLLNCKHELFVSGDDNTSDRYERDIRAEWLGLPSNFKGNFTICPKQKQGGVIVEFNQNLSKFSDSNLFDGFWVGVTAPLVTVENNINVSQWNIQNPGADGPTDLVQALCQKDWMYGKFCSCPRKTTQLAELRLAFGHAFVAENNFLFASYSHLSIPTGNVQCPDFIFDAVSGNNGHLGIGGGVNIQFVLNRENTSPFDFCFFLNLEATWFARDTQRRVFDLMQKPWSRYLQLVHKNDPTRLIPGVNILTREVRARPYGFVDFSTGIRIKTEHVECELGYNIWGHSTEKLELLCPFPRGYGIADVQDQTSSVARTASGSTISMRAANDVDTNSNPVFVELVASDLNLNSPAAQSVLNHKVHFSIGATGTTEKVDAFAGAGIFYDIPQHNGALKLWGIWAKFGLGF